MGDLNSEISELKSLNLFLHAIKGLPDIERHPCFNSINYQGSFFPIFKITVSNEGIEESREITPDVLLWNINNKTALILEVKGGNSVEDSDLDQISKYLIIPIDQIEKMIRNIVEDPAIEIMHFYVGIVYYEKTIQNCINSSNCINKLNSIKNNFFILKQSPGESLNIWNPDFISFDNELLNLLNNGIQIPLNPRQSIYITENPSIEGTIWGIINYIQDKFFERTKINEIKVDPFQLRDEFRYSSVKLKRLGKSLNYLVQIGCCKKDQNSFIFNFESFDNLESLKEKIMQIDTEKPPWIQQQLNQWDIK